MSAGLGVSTSLVAQTVKNLPAVRETHTGSLGWKDPLEKGMATHSSVLAWRIPWTIQYNILQARILEWVAIPFSRGSFQPRDQTHVSRVAGEFFTSSATRKAQNFFSLLEINSLGFYFV